MKSFDFPVFSLITACKIRQVHFLEVSRRPDAGGNFPVNVQAKSYYLLDAMFSSAIGTPYGAPAHSPNSMMKSTGTKTASIRPLKGINNRKS